MKAIELLLDVFQNCDILAKDRNGKGILHKAVHQLQESYDVKNAAKKFSVSLRKTYDFVNWKILL